MHPATTRVSSRGQVVIPAAIRNLLHLVPGDELVVEVAAGERAIILRAGAREDIESRLAKGYEWLERTGADLVGALHQERKKERERERERRRRGA